jgi:hypothetical protein
MTQAVSYLPLIEETWVRSLARPCDMLEPNSDNAIGFFACTSISPCQCYSTNALYSSSFLFYWFQEDNPAKPGNLLTKQ